jgi:hypothetical protein
LGLRGFAGIDSNGLSGGLALYWSEQIEVIVQEVTERYIDIHVRLAPQDPLWRLTCVYGEPRVDQRHLMWAKIQELKSRSALPWCLMGDFNEAMWSFEHYSKARGTDAGLP